MTTFGGPCESEEELMLRLNQLLSVPGSLDSAADNIYDNLVEEIVLGIVFEMHHLYRIGGIPVVKEEELKLLAIVDNGETDIFGYPLKKSPSIISTCPSCQRQLSASRFAPHVANCLGMGRNSSRIASRRIASNCKENAYGGISDDEFDDWEASQEKSKLNKRIEFKKKKDKNGIRRNKLQKIMTLKNLSMKVPEDYIQTTKYESGETKN